MIFALYDRADVRIATIKVHFVRDPAFGSIGHVRSSNNITPAIK